MKLPVFSVPPVTDRSVLGSKSSGASLNVTVTAVVLLLSDRLVASSSTVAVGFSVSMVIDKGAELSLMLPARSAAVAVSTCVPGENGVEIVAT